MHLPGNKFVFQLGIGSYVLRIRYWNLCIRYWVLRIRHWVCVLCIGSCVPGIRQSSYYVLGNMCNRY